MPHSRRFIESKQPYAITFRVKEGLPFVATYYMNLLLGGIMARAQRDNKITICHDLWMANHIHLFGVSKDPYALTAFYAEVEKKITDCIKKLLGLEHLNLWQERPVVALVADLDAAIDQIVYLYANPARANLIATISEYPGLNSYKSFISTASSIHAVSESVEHWVRTCDIPRLPERSMRKQKDALFAAKLKKVAIPHSLVRTPNAWMECFGIEADTAVAEVNQRILSKLEEREAEHAESRSLAKKSVLGERALRVQPIMLAHKPAKCERRVYVIASDREVRRSFIESFQELCVFCRECFLAAMRGLHVDWPPGVFRPALRHVASAVAG